MNDTVSALIVAQLLFLESENPTKPISLYINSPGGVVTAGMAIYDTVSSFYKVLMNEWHTHCLSILWGIINA